MAAAADDALFSDALRYLQNAHETQVALLLKENSALRTELQELYSGAEWYQRVQERKDSRENTSLGSAEEREDSGAESRAEKVEPHAEALPVVVERHAEAVERRAEASPEDESGSRHRDHLKRQADRRARNHIGPKGSPVPGASPRASPLASPRVAEEKIGGKAPHPKESKEEGEEHEREELEAELHQLEEDDPELAQYLWDRRSQRSKAPSAAAVAKPKSFASAATVSRAPPPNPARQRQLLTQVMEMGFDEPSAKRALAQSGWASVEGALAMLLG